MLRELTIHEMSFVRGAEGSELYTDSQEYSGRASYSSYGGSGNVEVGFLGELFGLAKDINKSFLGSFAHDSFKDTPITGNPSNPGNAANGYGSFQKMTITMAFLVAVSTTHVIPSVFPHLNDA